MKNHNDMRGRVGGLGAQLGHNNYEIAIEFIIVGTIIFFDSYKYLCKNKSF
jgi:hypothetical protein